MKVRKCVSLYRRFRIAISGIFLLAIVGCRPQLQQPLPKQTISGSDGASVTFSHSGKDLLVEYRVPGSVADRTAVYLALGIHREIGSAVVPFQREQEGSTVFLPFKADLLLYTKLQTEPLSCHERKWERWKWSDATTSVQNEINIDNGAVVFRVPRSQFAEAKTIDCAVYAKDFSQNDGWGRFFGCSDPSTLPGIGDKYIPHYLELNLAAQSDKIATSRARYDFAGGRMRVYQLFVRLFGNTNETPKQNGTLAENGVGKFNDINDAALKSLHDSGFSHIWLTGILQQATGTDHSSIGQPPDDTDLLKGIAGSPYAIKDYFDVCPDYAEKPDRRLDEFKSLLDRIHKHRMKALIDFVPNHVARSYNSDVKPALNFGNKSGETPDDSSLFFAPQNNFFYLKPDGNGPPLRMPTYKDGQAISPTCKALAALKQGTAVSKPPTAETSAAGKPPLLECDGLFDGERTTAK